MTVSGHTAYDVALLHVFEAAVTFEASYLAVSLHKGLPFAPCAACVLLVYFPEHFCLVNGHGNAIFCGYYVPEDSCYEAAGYDG